MKLKSLLKSKLVLYTTFVVAILHVLGYMAVDDDKALLFFIALGVLTTFFSKNMIVVLVVAVIGTNVLFAGNAVREGLIGSKETDKEGEGGQKEEKKKKKKEGGKIPERAEKFTQINVPSSKPAPATETEEDGAIGKRIDYASTFEQAYDNLQQMLGPDGIKGLSKETQNLAHQQKSLIGTLNDMAPVLKTAKETLDTMSGSMPDFANIQTLVGGLLNKNKKGE